MFSRKSGTLYNVRKKIRHQMQKKQTRKKAFLSVSITPHKIVLKKLVGYVARVINSILYLNCRTRRKQITFLLILLHPPKHQMPV